jgi:hypothetical protein
MPKRQCETDQPLVRCFKLREDLILRVRFSAMNVDGSIMLFHAGVCMECVLFMEATDIENTERDWLRRYMNMYGSNTYNMTEEEIIKENEDAKQFSERMGVYSASSSKLVASDMQASPIKLELVSFDEVEKTIKLKMERLVPSTKWTIGHTMHVSMKLKFAEVVTPASV